MIPISPCDPNVMLFQPLVSKIWARTDQNGLTVQTELIVELELALIERKQSRRFRYNSIIWQKDTKGFALVGTVPRSKVMQS